MERGRTMEKVGELGLLAVVRGESRAAASELVGALVEGGVSGIEITFTTPEAGRLMEDLEAEYGDRILLGAGTITSLEQVERSVSGGAAFLVSPGCDPGLVTLMKETGLAVMPGAFTPTEVMLAQSLGADAVKLFPGSLGGPSYLRALRGPFPDVPILPTGGVSVENVRDWFEAGAFAVGAGGALAPASLDGDREEVVARTRGFVEAVRSAMDEGPRRFPRQGSVGSKSS